MNVVKIDTTNKLAREELYNFYCRHYNAPSYLLPESPDDIEGSYYAVVDVDAIIGVTKCSYPSPFSMKTSSTVVHSAMRRQGIATLLHSTIEGIVREKGVSKIYCHIYVDNLASIIVKLKSGYLVEGLLKDQDEPGKHEYIMGKTI